MKTLQIEIPEGFKIDSFDITTGQIKFTPTPKDIKEQIKTFQDAIEKLGEEDEDIKAFRSIENFGIPKHIIAHLQLIIIAKALNEGWTPNWSNSSQYKYYPWFDMENSSAGGFVYYDLDDWAADTLVGSRLCYSSRELAEYAGKQFKDIYEEYFVIK
ncbi:hypothetical protein [Empedobacter tilapiae]|uniref:hypothetical protein n=1 Tax=Empedobacter tilapiae TaxID=2491114 RepID=UPI0028D63CB1|nr:hypothetical protein [Empedobacter tilapiae]